MVVCSRCKQENEDGRIRCRKCGHNISSRGEYAATQGPAVVVLGSVEDMRRARGQGEDAEPDDPNALGWLGDEEIDDKKVPAVESDDTPRTRRVSVREIDKISGLKDLRAIQEALMAAESAPAAAPPKPAGIPTPAPPAAEESDEAAPEPEGPVTAYLVGELFPEPYALKTTKRYLVGRDPRASIFLPAPEVSRRHAGISADEKGSYWAQDLGSSNGTYVNGHAILKRKLREGDRLDVGPFTLRFVKAIPGAPPPSVNLDPNEETRAIRAVPGALAGEIENTGVRAVLALLHGMRRSGVLTLRAGAQVGRIFLIEGEVQHAQFAKTTGEGALASLLPAEAGLFHFQDEKIKVPRTVTRATKDILAT